MNLFLARLLRELLLIPELVFWVRRPELVAPRSPAVVASRNLLDGILTVTRIDLLNLLAGLGGDRDTVTDVVAAAAVPRVTRSDLAMR